MLVLAPGQVASDEFLACGWSFVPRPAPVIPLPAAGIADAPRPRFGAARPLCATTPITIEEAP
jgi:hypothetical protein